MTPASTWPPTPRSFKSTRATAAATPLRITAAPCAARSTLGDAGDNEWKSPEVKWVNKFRDAMEGNAEYLRNCQAENCLMIELYKSEGSNAYDGVVVVNMDGDKNLAGLETTLDDGTYTEQVNGGTITVANKKITAGSVKSGKVCFFVKICTAPTPDPGPTPDPDPTPDSTTPVYYPRRRHLDHGPRRQDDRGMQRVRLVRNRESGRQADRVRLHERIGGHNVRRQ